MKDYFGLFSTNFLYAKIGICYKKMLFCLQSIHNQLDYSKFLIVHLKALLVNNDITFLIELTPQKSTKKINNFCRSISKFVKKGSFFHNTKKDSTFSSLLNVIKLYFDVIKYNFFPRKRIYVSDTRRKSDKADIEDCPHNFKTYL